MPQINFPYSLTDGTKAMSAQVMANLNALKDALNTGIGMDNLADLIISTQKIIDLAVTTAKIADSAVITTKLADLNVTAAKIADLGVTSGKLADLSVLTSKINDLAVTTIKIADDNVVRTKLSPALRAELDSLQTQISNHKISSDHDNRYYTETELQSVTNGASGADKIGATPIATSPSTVQGILNWLKQQIDTTVLGQIPDGSITDAKLGADNKVGSLASLVTTIKDSLVNAINWLKGQLDATNNTVSTHLADEASLTVKGHVQLSSSISSTSETLAATPNAVKIAYDKAISAGGYVTGVYTGDGQATRTITLGFTPNFLIIIINHRGSSVIIHTCMASPGNPDYYDNYSLTIPTLKIVTNGFEIVQKLGTYYATNITGDVWKYIAFK